MQKLKERQAATGIGTDLAVLLEIEDIEATVASLQQELAALSDPPATHSATY